MFSSFSRSWELVKASWAILRADKELIVFPIVSMIGMVIVTIAFIIPSIAAGVFDSVEYDVKTGAVRIVLSANAPNTPNARLRIEQPASLPGVGRYALAGKYLVDAGDYTVPLNSAGGSVELRPTSR